MRPDTHRDQTPDKHCGNCRYSAWPIGSDYLWCFHGENVRRSKSGQASDEFVDLPDGRSIDTLEGDEMDQEWVKRHVDSVTDVCDEWSSADAVG